MLIRALKDEDFVNYKKPCMFIGTAYCSFKCETESGVRCCQNSALSHSPAIEISVEKLVDRYLLNNITSAVCFGGLEPMEQFEDVLRFVSCLRGHGCTDDVAIYTGYYKNEVQDKIGELKKFPNIVVKYGRFIPNQKSHFDSVLGVTLASDSQYAEKIS